MKKKQYKTQLVLISIGFVLFIFTYLYYPSINKDKEKQTGDELIVKEPKKDPDNEEITSFENLEYKGLYDLDKPFIVKSEKANILNEEPDLVYMTNMHVILYLSDDRIVEITSLSGRYNKANYNCYFEEDVIATDGETTITAKNLDLLATENYVKIYNNVYLDYKTGNLNADKIDYDFESKHFKVSMFDDRPIKIKLIQ